MRALLAIKELDGLSIMPLLETIGGCGEAYLWSILELESTGDIRPEFSYKQIECDMEKTCGFMLRWNELNILASKFSQVINAIFVGRYPDSSMCKDETFEVISQKYPLIISILDGIYWEVCTIDDLVINRIKKRFKNVEISEQ